MARKIIGITGGIGAGKSVVSRILRGLGYPVFDCDYEAKVLMGCNSELMRSLVELVGEATYSNGELDRAYLASVIFTDAEKRSAVNKLVHTAVRQEFQRRAQDTSGLFFVEAAIMASSGLAALCDSVWVVDAPVELRFKRALERGGISPEDLSKRFESQSNELEILKQTGVPTCLIDNSCTSRLCERIDELIDR